MTAQSPNAFFLSATLHALVVALLLLLTLGLNPDAKPPMKIFELVASPGDNYGATVAPKLGTPGGIKVDIPPPPKSEPAPEPPAPTPAKAEPAPPAVAEKAPPVPTPAKATPKQRTIAQDLRRKIIIADSKAKQQAQKERDEEEKRAKKAADAAKAAAKIARIDTAGIKAGLLAGSDANMIGGTGGKALTAEEGSEAERYIALLEQKLRDELEQVSGLDDQLHAEAEVHILADGRLARAQLTKRSGNEAFDVAVLRVIAAVRMPPRPKGVPEVEQIPFTTRAKE
ncbi:MAG TPA: TonB family protein [Opitutaceae bacterium]|nr:TonB family protein [Opitutaceae bacterium]